MAKEIHTGYDRLYDYIPRITIQVILLRIKHEVPLKYDQKIRLEEYLGVGWMKSIRYRRGLRSINY